ncbi:Arylamine N-acetyltransferase [Marinococcus luteus]|uniref:Arylamine N-acetyltransferase n=1 Tax=Marinococcus luteus TaxID=1122204 RepID=A0A1H2SBK0_9BACI|nr:arylamine N-acetyltransferase [Marinococcus luteus]SDW29041.1 Arylamine N-acetyltransferase [Marinococcus luteus]
MQSWVEDYLHILKLKIEQPDVRFLTKLIRSHLQQFPFENVGKLIESGESVETRAPMSVDSFLYRRQVYQMGGTCYTLNIRFQHLLEALGFSTRLIYLNEDHVSVRVETNQPGSPPYFVDVGTTAPLFEPIPLRRGMERSKKFDGEQLIFHYQKDARLYRYIRMKDGKQADESWAFDPDIEAEEAELRDRVCKSYGPDAPYMNQLRLQLWVPEKYLLLSLKNNKLIARKANGATVTKYIHDLPALERVVQEDFRLHYLPVRQAASQLEKRISWAF